MIPRPYQDKAIRSVHNVFQKCQSALIVMATGLGKTVCFVQIAKEFKDRGRIMVLAHREELISQAASHIERATGDTVDIEMAGNYATMHDVFKSDMVVSTIQTQNAGREEKRMERFDYNEFILLIIDEAHHATSLSYRKVIDYYKQNPNIKILGVTATPDRTDEEALGQVFDEVAFDYDIRDGIDDGWLVPISQHLVSVAGLDYSQVRTTAGELNGKDLAEVLEFEDNLHAIATPTIELTGDRKTLIFAASVAQAERLCEILNRHKPDSAMFVCGKTDKDLRRQTLKSYAQSQFQFLVNVGCFTEGFDEPGVQVVVMARPTKSRCLYTQMAGRGTRALPGIVDGPETSELRKQAILASGKPFVEIIDFVGNCGRHKLIGTADILGGKYSDEIIEQAKDNAEQKPGCVDMITELALAEQEIAARETIKAETDRRKALKAKAKYSTAKVNPFDMFDIVPHRERAWHKGKVPTDKQLAYLHKSGVDTSGLTFTGASQIIDKLISRMKTGECSYKQAKLLKRYKYDTSSMSFERAGKLITAIKNAGWKRPK